MTELTTCLQYHNAHRAVNCCLCGRRWDEQWVTVLLLDGEHGIGSLCPACLSRGPQETAEQLRRYATDLQSIAADFAPAPPSNGEATRALHDLALRVHALKRESERVRGATRQLLQASAEIRRRTTQLRADLVQAQAGSHRLINGLRERRERDLAVDDTASLGWVDDGEVAVLEAATLLDLAERFPRGRAWPTSIHEAIYAERRCFRVRLLDLSPQLLRRAVDDRYMRFISASA